MTTLGDHYDLGKITLVDNFDREIAVIDLLFVRLGEGSRKGIFTAGVKFVTKALAAASFAAAAFAAPPVVTDVYQMNEIIGGTPCATDVRTTMSAWDYYETILQRNITPPNAGQTDLNNCILQVALNESVGAHLVADGDAGPRTMAAWRTYRAGFASDDEAVRALMVDLRTDLGFAGILLDQIAKNEGAAGP